MGVGAEESDSGGRHVGKASDARRPTWVREDRTRVGRRTRGRVGTTWGLVGRGWLIRRSDARRSMWGAGGSDAGVTSADAEGSDARRHGVGCTRKIRGSSDASAEGSDARRHGVGCESAKVGRESAKLRGGSSDASAEGSDARRHGGVARPKTNRTMSRYKCDAYAREGNVLGLARTRKGWTSNTCANAALGGSLACLRWLHEKGVKWNGLTPLFAAKNGHLECLSYAVDHGCPYGWVAVMAAAANGHLECMKYLFANGVVLDYIPHTYLACENAAMGGHLECLQFAHSNGCELDRNVGRGAVMGGNVACLRYVHENDVTLDAAWCTLASAWE